MSSKKKACDACTYLNSRSASFCKMCGTDFVGANLPPPPSASDLAHQWACSACTCHNPASRKRCKVCGTKRAGIGAALAGAVTGGSGDTMWTCEACTMANPASVVECQTCGTKHPAAGSTHGNATGGRGSSSTSSSSSLFNLEKIGPTVWKIVEEDRYGQFPFIYVIMGIDKCVVFDTGCDSGASVGECQWLVAVHTEVRVAGFCQFLILMLCCFAINGLVAISGPERFRGRAHQQSGAALLGRVQPCTL